jgi:hypothetical protein
MPKHYKEMMDEIINKMDESAQKGFIVKFAKSKGAKISQAWYRSKADAQKALAMLKKNGLNGIITPGYLDDTMEKVEEDAPANSVAGGGVDLAPNAAVSQSPHMIKRKKEQGAEQEKIKNKIKKMVQNNEDNNNIIFKQILDGLDKVETKLDEKVYGKTEIKEVEKEDYKSFKDKYVEDVRKMPDGRFGVYADKFKNKKRVMTPGGKHAKELKKVYKNEKDANDYMAAIMIAKGG